MIQIFRRSAAFVLLLALSGAALAQSELRATFFKDADAARAAAEAADASLLAPRSWSRAWRTASSVSSKQQR